MKKVMVIVGSVRKGRAAEKVLGLVKEELKNYPNLEIDLADLKDVELPFYNHPLPPSTPNFEYEDAKTADWGKRVADADGFIFLTPEYNHSTSGVLKNAFDWVHVGWVGKPVSFVAWGVNGGVRAVEHLRQIVLQPAMRPLRAATYVPIFTAFDSDGKLTDDSVTRQLGRTIEELNTTLQP